MLKYSQELYIQGRMLDRVLAKGWYRGGNRIFTTDTIYYDEHVEPGVYKVYWLRYNLAKLSFSSSVRKILRQSTLFNLAFVRFTYSEEYASLYQKYRECKKFSTANTLYDFLHGNFGYQQLEQFCHFDTRAITIRNNEGTLIGCGITDMGKNAMAGICNFYDPEYQKQSLGKMCVALKIVKALNRKMLYFYPGYIVPGIPAFDYKTFVGTDCVEVWDMQAGIWKDWHDVFP